MSYVFKIPARNVPLIRLKDEIHFTDNDGNNYTMTGFQDYVPILPVTERHRSPESKYNHKKRKEAPNNSNNTESPKKHKKEKGLEESPGPHAFQLPDNPISSGKKHKEESPDSPIAQEKKHNDEELFNNSISSDKKYELMDKELIEMYPEQSFPEINNGEIINLIKYDGEHYIEISYFLAICYMTPFNITDFLKYIPDDNVRIWRKNNVGKGIHTVNVKNLKDYFENSPSDSNKNRERGNELAQILYKWALISHL